MNKEVSFTTLDAYRAGFLCMRGNPVDLEQQGSKVVFVFKKEEKLMKDIKDYDEGAKVSAMFFAMAVKALKGRMFNFKS